MLATMGYSTTRRRSGERVTAYLIGAILIAGGVWYVWPWRGPRIKARGRCDSTGAARVKPGTGHRIEPGVDITGPDRHCTGEERSFTRFHRHCGEPDRRAWHRAHGVIEYQAGHAIQSRRAL